MVHSLKKNAFCLGVYTYLGSLMLLGNLVDYSRRSMLNKKDYFVNKKD